MLFRFAFVNAECGIPRTNKRKTTRASYSSEDIAAAVKKVVDEGLKISAELSFVLSQFTRVTDRQTGRHVCHRKDRTAYNAAR